MSFITALSRLACTIAAILLAATGVMLTYEVIARYFFIRPTIWAAELSQLCLIWGCLLAMAYLLTMRRHITVNAVTSLLPAPAQKACTAISLIAVIVFSAIVAYWGVGLPAAYVLGFPLGMAGPGIWLGLAIGLSFAALMMMTRFWRRADLIAPRTA